MFGTNICFNFCTLARYNVHIKENEGCNIFSCRRISCVNKTFFIMNLHPIVLPFVILANAVVAVKETYLQNGKLNISQTFEQWSCNSGCTPSYHCRLPRCTSVAFPKTFSGSEKVQVHVSLSHGEEFSRVHSPSAMWVRSITTRGFDVCVRETGSARNESGVINWVAFQDNPGMIPGSLVFSGIWTTETKCNKVDFSQGFGLGPYVFVSAKYNRDTQPNDAMYVWLENVKRGSFEVCIREFLPFDGQHQNAIVDWFAFDGNGSDLNFTLMGEAGFENRNTPKVEDNYGFCQDVQFNTTFYASPVVLVSVHHYYNRQQKNLILPENNIVTAWVEEIRLTSMTICVKDLSGTGSKHDPLSVYYVVIGDIDPCLGVNCPSFGICKTFSAHESRCVCHEDCPSYQDPVCTTNGTTYDNHCWYKLNYCKGLEQNSVYHPGSCVGFPIVRDKVELRVPRWSDSSCQTVVFPPYHFYPEKLVQVQITVTHMNLNDSERVHDAVTSWIEDTNTYNFTVCAMQSGRRSRNFNPFATIVWVAYQGAPPNGMTGIIKMQKWWSGTKCADVTFSKDKFKSTPVVLVTAEHLRTGIEYDAALIWTEDATKDSFKVCLREMQNFDGKHEDINVNWMAFTDLHKPFFKERGFVKFPNTNPPLDENNNAYCQFVLFAKSYNSTPSVLVTANHRTDNGNSAPVHNGITAWIENMNSTGFRACLKELYETRYEPVSLSYVVLTNICEPGWSYFNGHCYFTSKTCANWTTALRNCRNENSAIADVESSEENVFIQHRHNGEKSWLGLNDRSSECNFTWVDRGRGNFTAWANNQPNNFKEEDCVHALGIKYRYEWNDVKCSDCHKYTCKKDLDECNTNLDACNRKASCNNTEGSYTCLCDNPYQGDGFDCSSTLGLYSSNPAHSCKEMRDLGLSRKNGRYWIDPEKNGNPLKVFCDMTTDGGGWLLVSEVVVDSSNQRFPFSVESSYRGISKSQMFLSNNAMQQLRQHLSFTQLRFYC
ncbi:uncharacterized protein LOC111343760 isoform X1 [Stylophora pistillata]|uniref:uncharacterized protein LOC111343760 isoform X1 n=2 Tax=Stylophora pistillata TaxID=50429 RepID=UPI000C052716|nr:uncharacterized protein LOC111343760 isoform X1 [Stylophora pistillata]